MIDVSTLDQQALHDWIVGQRWFASKTREVTNIEIVDRVTLREEGPGIVLCLVEAQLRLPTSLLRWMRRFIALRKEHPVFGLGTYEPLEPSNAKVFAHIRTYEEDVMLCVHNLARSAQAVELDLSAHEGRSPVEIFGRSRFPRIGELPYLLTLAPRGFYWFQLVKDEPE